MKIRRVDFSPTEWLEGTIGLDLAERGLYITACALIYSRGGPITIDLLRAASPAHGKLFNRCFDRLVALGKIDVNGAQLSNKRCLNELQNASNRSEIAAQNVSKRWAKQNKHNGLADTTVIPGGNANHQPSTINHHNNPPIPPKGKRASYSDEFEEWYSAYPRHVGKIAAAKKYDAVRRSGIGAEELLSAAKRYGTAKAGTDAQFIAQPVTWLNQGRWQDEIATEPTIGFVSDGPKEPPPKPSSMWRTH